MHTYGNYNDSSMYGDGAFAAFFAVFLFIWAFFGFAMYIFCGFAGMAFLKKARHPQPWAAWVPVYNNWVILEVGRQAGWWALVPLVGAIVGLIPILGQIISFAASVVAIIAMIYAIININKSLGHEQNLGGWTVLGAILYPVWLGIVAWNKDHFDPNRGTPGPIFFPNLGHNNHAQYAGAGYSNQGYSQQSYNPNSYQQPQQGYNPGAYQQPPQSDGNYSQPQNPAGPDLNKENRDGYNQQ